MKKIFKAKWFVYLIIAVTFLSVGVLADDLIDAHSVLYAPNNSAFEVDNVQDALDELYSKTKGNSFCRNITGDKNTVGSKYECDPGDGVWRTFYVLKVNEDTIDMILSTNLPDTVQTVTIGGEMTFPERLRLYFTSGAGATIKASWTNTLNVDVPKGQDIMDAVCVIDSSLSFCGTELAKSRGSADYNLPGCSSNFHVFGCESFDLVSSLNQGNYWLYECGLDWEYGWTYSNNLAWHVYNGKIEHGYSNTPSKVAIRPVITVSKNNL